MTLGLAVYTAAPPHPFRAAAGVRFISERRRPQGGCVQRGLCFSVGSSKAGDDVLEWVAFPSLFWLFENPCVFWAATEKRREKERSGTGIHPPVMKERDAGTCPMLLFSLLTARLFVAQENCREGERCTCLSCRNKQGWKAVVNGAELYPSSPVPFFFLSVLWTSPGQIWGQHGLYNVWSHQFFCIWSSYSFGYRKWRVYSRIPGLFCNPVSRQVADDLE